MKFTLFAALLLMTAAFSLPTYAAPKVRHAVADSMTLATVPVFTSAAIARNWGNAEQSDGHYELAAQAYFQEASLRLKLGDAQGSEVELRRAWRLATTISVAMPVSFTPDASVPLAKLEPAAGCYIGTLDTPGEGHTFAGESTANDFAQRIGRNVAVAFRYVKYGEPFPFAWAHQQAEMGRAIELAMEPYDIWAVSDDDYLEGFAADMNQSGVNCFLRFGGEMNGEWAPWGKDPEAYKHAFRVVHDVMAHFAPRCAMVWAPDMMPLDNIDKYYPGDDYVDWVGLSLYLVKYYDDNKSEPGWQDSPSVYIDPFYKKYAARKPMCLVECGVTRDEAVDDGTDCDDYAAARISDLLSAIKVRYPRLKMFCWFDRNNLNGVDVDRRLNDYSLPPGSKALAAFRAGVADPYFLSSLPQNTDTLVDYQTVDGSRLPSGFSGPLALSVTTYSLNPTITVTRDGQSSQYGRPFDVTIPPGVGLVTITVKDDTGRVAKSITLNAPQTDTLASR